MQQIKEWIPENLDMLEKPPSDADRPIERPQNLATKRGKREQFVNERTKLQHINEEAYPEEQAYY